MVTPLTQIFSFAPPTFALSDIQDFPVEQDEANEARYIEYEDWYSGATLEETVTQNGKEVEIYPVKINPIRGAVMKHAAVLFGDIEDDGRPLVTPRIVQNGDGEEEEMAKAAEDALNMLWYENHGRAIQLRNGILSQYMGGCVFKLTYVPEETWRTIPIRIELIHPRNFIGIADASDFWRLRRGWIVRLITKELAKEYGVVVDNDHAYYVEDWTPQYYRVLIDGQIASMPIPGSFSERRDLAGTNPWGIVPMTYIPHIRTKGFYGESIVSGLEGIVKEINLRAGDYGDAVSDDAHVWLAMRNVNGTPRTIEVAPGLKVLDLKSSPSVTGNENKPDIFPLKQAMASESMGKLWDRLYDQFRRDSFVPAVADGEDEGSQRSAMTLAFRMWPLVGHINMERTLWTTGLNWFNTMALRMMATKDLIKGQMSKMGLKPITMEHSRLRMRQDWSQMFPRDRETVINEITARAAADAGSIDTLLELAGDIENIEAEKDKIVAWKKLITEASTPPPNDMSEISQPKAKTNQTNKNNQGGKT